MGKGPVQAPFSTCLHSSCSRCVHERPDDRQLESSTTFTKDFNQVKALSRSFASGGPENKLESEIRAEETHRSGQTRKDSLGKTDMTHGPQSSTSPLPDMAREELYMPQKPGSVRFGAYRELLSTRFLSRDHKLQRTSAEIDTFVKEDLNLDRLNNIHGWLWLVGRPEAARPLHGQLMRKRTIIVTEQMDLHLTWNDSSLYIKPLPAYLLCTKFWKDYLCEDPVLHERACGFLLSYSWLICYNSDFLIATKGDKAPYLIPSIITWSTGQSFIEEFLDALDSEHAKIKVNRRYEFGELRLARLNQICRFAPLWWYLLADPVLTNRRVGKITGGIYVQGDKHLIRGYHYGYYQYSSFFSRNFAQLIIIFAYITVVLSAMQVVMSIDGVKDDPRLQRASYGFSVFSMVLVAAISGVVVFLVLLFGYHLSATALAHVAIQRGNNIDKTGKKTC